MNIIKKLLIIIFVLLVSVFQGCEDQVLDKFPRDIFSEADVWSDIVLAKQFATSVYLGLGNWRSYTGSGLTSSVSDEGIGNTAGGDYAKGLASPESLGYWDAIWTYTWRYIRMANIFLENIDKVENTTEDAKAILKGEVKYIRAVMYFDLIKAWGGVPLIDYSFSLDDDFMIPRDSYEKIVDWIVNELEAASKMVPATRSLNEWGRITLGACLAMKSRVLLYANSKLHDPSSQPSGPLFSYSKNTWQECANAAKAVIDMSQYELVQVENYRDYQKIWITKNSEQILVQPLSAVYNTSFADHAMCYLAPRGMGGYSTTQPTHNFVQEFQMVNGKSINDPESGYDPSPTTIYNNRELRFYANILYQGSYYRGEPLKYYGGGGEHIFSVSGYCINKYQDETIDLRGGERPSHPWVFIRLAEMYLNYAEAQYELGNEDEARKYVNIIRNRVKLPDINYTGIDLFKSIQHERKVELCFENHRIYDANRWMIAEVTGSIDIVAPAWGEINGELTYEIIPHMVRNFPHRQYYMPIPRAEINKSDLEQNPGYN